MLNSPDTLFTVALYLLSSLVQADAAILGLGAIFIIYKLQGLGSQYDFALNYCSQNAPQRTAAFMMEFDKPNPDSLALDDLLADMKEPGQMLAVRVAGDYFRRIVKIRKQQSEIQRLLKLPLIVIGVHTNIVAILLMFTPLFDRLDAAIKTSVFWTVALAVVIWFVIGVTLACVFAWKLVIQNDVQASNSQTTPEATSMNTKWKECPATDKWMVFTTCLLALGSFVLIYLTIVQIGDIERNSKRQLKAFISVLPPIFDGRGIAGNPLAVACRLKNSGQTAAYNVRDVSELLIVPRSKGDSLPDPRDFKVIPAPKAEQYVIGPEVEVFLWKHPAREPMNLGGLLVKDYAVIFRGRIFYTDVFGDEHWTSFAYSYQMWISGGTFYAYGQFNDADKNG
jgi:hypothetical protein